MTSIVLHEGDNRVALRRLIDQGVRVHSVVTDPPYHLESITKRFGKESAAPAKFGSDGAFARSSRGFMGSQWDGADASGVKIAFDPEFWRLIHDILLPGGYVVAFSGSRTGHWQACAMEMAGFIMHPFLGWVFGQGFPKAHNAAMAIDKALGVQGGRGAPKSAAHAGWIERGAMRGDGQDNNEGWQRPWMEDADKVAAAASKYLPGSDEAAQWDGWAYGGQALKPAIEPIYVGQKPFSEKNGALNILKHGVGAINIDGCRNGETGARNNGRKADTSAIYGDFGSSQRVDYGKGRHPANLLHDGSDEVVALFPQTTSGKPGVMRKGVNDGACYGAESRKPGTQMTGFGDSGSAARFFNSFPNEYEEVDVSWTSEDGPCLARLLVDTAQSPPRVIAASGSAENSDWNTFLFGSTTTAPFQMVSKSTIETKTSSTTASRIWNFWTRSLISGSMEDARLSTANGGSLVESAESPNTLTITMREKTAFLRGASPALSQTPLRVSVVAVRHADPIFYHGKATKGDRAGSGHPTVKPVALMQWLVRLVTPVGGVTLDPFAGSGTTGEAARREGFDCILMEAEEQFIGDIRTRFGLPAPVADFDDFDALLEDDFSDLL